VQELEWGEGEGGWVDELEVLPLEDVEMVVHLKGLWGGMVPEGRGLFCARPLRFGLKRLGLSEGVCARLVTRYIDSSIKSHDLTDGKSVTKWRA
jgi:hypothetical protein